MIQNSDESYTPDTVLTRNLLVQGYIPQTGNIYNANTTIYVKNLYISTCLLNTSDLVFYTDLNYNYINRIYGNDSLNIARNIYE